MESDLSTEKPILDITSGQGCTALDVSVQSGNYDGVEILLKHGAEPVPGILKILIDCFSDGNRNKERLETLKQVYRKVTEHMDQEMQTKDTLQLSLEGYEIKLNINSRMRSLLEKRDIKISHEYRQLTPFPRFIGNRRGNQISPQDTESGQSIPEIFNAIEYACLVGMPGILTEIFDTSGVYKLETPFYVVNDVTNVFPSTIPPIIPSTIPKVETEHPVISLVEYITQRQSGSRKKKMFEITPIEQMIENYWRFGERLVLILISFHIFYMSIFSYYNTLTKEWLLELFQITSDSYVNKTN